MSRFGDLLGKKPSAPSSASPTPPDPVVESVVEEPAVEEVVEEPTVEAEEEVKLIPYESDLSLHDMNKDELEAYGRTVGIELDRRLSRKKLVRQLEDYLGVSDS